MSTTSIVIICSPHAKTGVSTMTRLLCDYMTYEERAFALFDTDPHSRALGGWFPASCTIADLSTTRGQIALFDELVRPGDVMRIVEVSSQIYSRFFSQARDIGLFDEATKNGLDAVVLFVSNGAEVAVHAAGALQAAFRELDVIPVVNQGPVRLGKDIHDHVDAFEARQSFLVPHLQGSAREAIENPRFSLSGFLATDPPADMSLVVRADLRTWLKRVFTQFHAYEVRKAFDESRYLLGA
jgi:hypothetical protein